MTALTGSSFGPLGGSCLRGSGHAEARALTIVHWPTPVLLLDRAAGHPCTGIPADRGVKLDLRRARGERYFITNRIQQLTISNAVPSELANNDSSERGPRSPLTPDLT